jgi:hypothetical protein
VLGLRYIVFTSGLNHLPSRYFPGHDSDINALLYKVLEPHEMIRARKIRAVDWMVSSGQ